MSSKASLGDHLRELRSRLLVVAVSFIIWSGIGYLLRQPIITYILKPLGQAVYYNTPQGGFEFLMRIIMTFGVICAVPIMVYELIRFVEPAINKQIGRKLLRQIVVQSSVLTLAGVAFGYAIILPTSLQFFSEFSGAHIKALIAADQYLTFVLGILITFALMFQLPLIINIVDHIKPIPPKRLSKYRRHVIVGSLVVALLLPFTYDPITQFVIAAPIIVLFELSVMILRWHHRTTRAQKRQKRIDWLVKALQEANAPVPQIVQAPVVEPVPATIAVEEKPQLIAAKPKVRVVVGSAKLSSRQQPRVLDLRNAH